MHPIGTRVVHDGHGPGTIVALNQVVAHSQSTRKQAPNSRNPVLLAAIASGYFDRDRYPYVVQFDSGYRDVYDVDNVTLFLEAT